MFLHHGRQITEGESKAIEAETRESECCYPEEEHGGRSKAGRQAKEISLKSQETRMP
jgi:hypothetical protein